MNLHVQLALGIAMAEIQRQRGDDLSVSEADDQGRVSVEGTLDLAAILSAVLQPAPVTGDELFTLELVASAPGAPACFSVKPGTAKEAEAFAAEMLTAKFKPLAFTAKVVR